MCVSVTMLLLNAKRALQPIDYKALIKLISYPEPVPNLTKHKQTKETIYTIITAHFNILHIFAFDIPII